jgi:hypothetical protein
LPALVAQRIEHLTTDQKVGGSSPSKRTFTEGSRTMNLSVWGAQSIASEDIEFDMGHCPFCGVRPPVESTCWAIISPWIRELGVTKRRVCRYLICEGCNVGWFSLRYSENGMQSLYKNYRGERYTAVRHKWETWYDSKYNSVHESPRWIKLRAEAISSFLRDKLDLSESEVVDIGGDTGQIAALLGAKSFRVVEISNRAVDSKTQWLTYPTIAVLAHVLEHVRIPKTFLADTLRNYNSLYVEVPNGVPAITAERRSNLRLVIGLAASLSPRAWRRFANPSAGRKHPAKLLRVSEHLTFFEQSFFDRLSAQPLGIVNLVSCRTLKMPSLDGNTQVGVIQSLWIKRR